MLHLAGWRVPETETAAEAMAAEALTSGRRDFPTAVAVLPAAAALWHVAAATAPVASAQPADVRLLPSASDQAACRVP